MGAEDGEVYNCTSSKVTSGSIGGRSESKNRGGESREKEQLQSWLFNTVNTSTRAHMFAGPMTQLFMSVNRS